MGKAISSCRDFQAFLVARPRVRRVRRMYGNLDRQRGERRDQGRVKMAPRRVGLEEDPYSGFEQPRAFTRLLMCA
jgi:hypothetical protein